MEIRQAPHSEDAKYYTTDRIRKEFLIENMFVPGEVNRTYSHIDRIIVISICPAAKPLSLEENMDVFSSVGTKFFLQRRELGVINVGGPGKVEIDGTTHKMNKSDGLYVGMGTKEVTFYSDNPENPAKFYCNSAPAHKTFPTKLIKIENAGKLNLGNPEQLNVRTIYQYLHPAVLETCQLLMGMTILEKGNVWNTMPCHTHERRMEVYFYFDIPEEDIVFHYMGKPEETRHLAVRNEEAVISPSWSIHSGVGTTSYTFIWGMVGENQEFSDMDHVPMSDLK